MFVQPIYNKRLEIHAPAFVVWKYLTTVELMKQWMAEPELQLEIQTDWNVHSPFIIRGFHHIAFENKGTILQLEPNKTFAYTQLDSISKLKDEANNYTLIQFNLNEEEQKTTVELTISNFPTETIYKHLEFYWNGTLELLKKIIEDNH